MLTQPSSCIKVLQHNVQHWKSRRINLINAYMQEKPDILLLNSHGLPNHELVKIPGYTCYYQHNRSGQLHAGVAIAVKRGIQHKIHDDFHFTDTLSVKLMTTLGPVNLATTYIPPREGCIIFPDLYKILRIPEPAYIVGDL